MVRRALFCIAVCIAVGCSHAPEWPDRIVQGDYVGLGEYLDARIEHEVSKSNIVGLSIAVVDGEDIVYSRGFGYADRETGVRATPQTVYRLGSLSKPVTTTALMQLVERGVVDLDAPLARYLPEFSIQSRLDRTEVTVRSILSHQSGLPNLWRRSLADGTPVPYNELVGDMKNAYLVHPPGLVTKYSNHGYNLIGCMIERITGEPFADYVRRRVMQPLAMETASFAAAPVAHPALAKAYRGGKPVTPLPPLDGEVPAGGLHGSVIDYTRFIRMFFGTGVVDGSKVLEPLSVTTIVTPITTSPFDFDEHPGLAWFHFPVPGLAYAGVFANHGGNTFVYHSRAFLHLEHKLAVVAATNTAEAQIGTIIETAMKLALEVKAGLRPPRTDTESTDNAAPAGGWEAYAGRYQTQVGVIDVTGGRRLEARLFGRRFRLTEESKNRFFARYLLLGSVPISIRDVAGLRFSFAEVRGHKVIAVEDRGRRVRLGEKVEPGPISPVWRGRVGDYNLANATHGEVAFQETPHVKLRFEDDYLIAYVHPAIHPSVELSWVLFPVTETEAVFAGFSNYLGGETMRIIRVGGEERLEFSGYEFARATE